jgi:hypothetical protein
VMLRHPPAAQLQVITANERRSPRGRQCPSALVKCDTPSFARSFAFCRGASRVLSAVISRKRNDTSRHKRKGGKLLYSKVRDLRVVRADEPLVCGLDLARLRLKCLWNVRTTICTHYWWRRCNVQAVSRFGICRHSSSGDVPFRAANNFRCSSQAAQSHHVGSDLNTL